MVNKDNSKKYKTLEEYSGDFSEELDKELRKIPALKEKLIYLYQLKRQNEHNNVQAGGFYYYGMVILSKLKYYDTALQYSKAPKKTETVKKENKNEACSKIVWKKSKQDLIALIDKLIDLGFIGYEKDKEDLLSEHFAWMYEEPAKKKTGSSNYKIIKNPADSQNNNEIKSFLSVFEKKKE